MRPTPKRSIRVIHYNGNFNSDSNNDLEFVDVDPPCNKLSVWLLANDSINRMKNKHIVETRDETNKLSKVKAFREKKIPVKQVGTKSSKASVPISGLVGKSFPDIQAIFINTNIVIPVLHFF